MSEARSAPPPVLPPELELAIFETAARACPPFVPTLMLVSKRVREWVEPILYHTLIFGTTRAAAVLPTCPMEVFLEVAARKGHEFLRRAVKNVMAVEISGPDVRAILEVCSRVENLYIIWGNRLLGTLEMTSASLRHLHAPVLAMFDATLPNFRTHRTFQQLTHLELLDLPFGFETAIAVCKAVLSIPSLTHFALNGDSEADFDEMSQSNIYAELLRDDVAQKLLALVVLTPYEPTEQFISASDDVRFVAMRLSEYFSHWAMARLYPAEEFWTHVDTVIARRRLTGDNSIQPPARLS
ncbi:hypothetical protein MIND_00568600 [Mycena indigotica]|uniref:Uncharacterized protein n=1 Tax=Mycena indigotica TaxID=2126181 RepID=A0A8H6SS57_9AGAR|nr:uncharacterized protein MIND_00568600 [Mycena indigotica]KAF7303402.1 hypothetical protein MIND_00568600 [Mycena indigotica]